MLNLLHSEFTKLRTTPAAWWTLSLILLIPALAAFALAGMSRTGVPYIPLSVVGVGIIPVLLLVIIQSAMVVTTEYRFNLPATNYRLNPRRWQVGVVKLLLSATTAAAGTFVAFVIAFFLGDLIAAVPANWTHNPAVQRALWALPLAMALTSVLSQGIGWCLRNTAGTITLVMVLQVIVESIAPVIPRYGQEIAQYLPFSNLYAFMLNQPRSEIGTWGALGVFAVWAVALWLIGLVSLERRDA
ncbi:ABC transporter permease [Corynebacterium mayonis]|uniref:ABC transporter permease n=1 Tax=Corynebacterium mayonis TaxID=3062461 RepID=UPI00314086C0